MKTFNQYIVEVIEPAGAPFEKLFQLGPLTHYRSRVPREDDAGHHLVDTSILHRLTDDNGTVADVSFKVDSSLKSYGYQRPFAKIYGAVLDHMKDFLKDNPKVKTITHNTDDEKKSKIYDRIGKKFGMSIVNKSEKNKST